MRESSSVSLEALRSDWEAAVGRTVPAGEPCTVLYSGGLDSSIVAVGLRHHAEVRLVTVGMPGSPDLRAARRGADLIGLPWLGHEVTPDELRTAAMESRALLPDAPPTTQAVLVGMALGLDMASTPHVVCGQGADELFLGYAHFEGLTAADAEQQREQDLSRLLDQDWPASGLLATRRGRQLGSPFLDTNLLSRWRKVPIERLRSGPGRKPLLRSLGRALGLPPEIAERPKKAFQYGSGLSRALRAVG